jgi:hypothetical protein
VLRLHFTPAPGVRDVDWRGAALLDSATSVLRRVEFQLAGLRDGDLPARLEGFTDFMAPAPHFVAPDSTVAWWWRSGPNRAGVWGPADAAQVLATVGWQYRGEVPAGEPQDPRARVPSAVRRESGDGGARP